MNLLALLYIFITHERVMNVMTIILYMFTTFKFKE